MQTGISIIDLLWFIYLLRQRLQKEICVVDKRWE